MTPPPQEPKTLHLVGIGVTHSIAPAMHTSIAKSLGLPWTFHATECPSLADVLALARDPRTAGLVVTMPYKNTIIPHLDELDELTTEIGACNNVHYTYTYTHTDTDAKNEPGARRLLRGTNTDWRGIKGCLLEAGDEAARPTAAAPGAGLIIGAGGASRAAVYALSRHLHCRTIYVVNRDEGEVRDLVRDVQARARARGGSSLAEDPAGSGPEIIHVRSVEEAERCVVQKPYYIVGTVPDFEPKTEGERVVAEVLEWFLERGETAISTATATTTAGRKKGVVLDMCFKPRRTRMLRLAERLGWPVVEGTHVIGYQIEEQWRLWAGEEAVAQMDREGAWRVLLQAAEESTVIN
jgi:quinate dehydrogenase